jgi:uncharacterized membrane protein HdeD (DUF308 family)
MNQTIRPVSHLIHRIWSSAFVLGLLTAILGLVILVWPGPSIVVASGVFGVYLVVSGCASGTGIQPAHLDGWQAVELRQRRRLGHLGNLGISALR